MGSRCVQSIPQRPECAVLLTALRSSAPSVAWGQTPHNPVPVAEHWKPGSGRARADPHPGWGRGLHGGQAPSSPGPWGRPRGPRRRCASASSRARRPSSRRAQRSASPPPWPREVDPGIAAVPRASGGPARTCRPRQPAPGRSPRACAWLPAPRRPSLEAPAPQPAGRTLPHAAGQGGAGAGAQDAPGLAGQLRKLCSGGYKRGGQAWSPGGIAEQAAAR